ncbi:MULTISPECIES: hypothetical protein [Clostridium]|uniref:Uncharacterized protein n=1 Tax=bioreactor metagenome TaxID=1076179 RepID=A0A644VT73_9ZZZZ|nr:hypothetical protein [Clostridium sp. C8]KLE16001.1 hypothetical protein AAT22_08460 [Clostridium sp. C8]
MSKKEILKYLSDALPNVAIGDLEVISESLYTAQSVYSEDQFKNKLDEVIKNVKACISKS